MILSGNSHIIPFALLFSSSCSGRAHGVAQACERWWCWWLCRLRLCRCFGWFVCLGLGLFVRLREQVAGDPLFYTFVVVPLHYIKPEWIVCCNIKYRERMKEKNRNLGLRTGVTVLETFNCKSCEPTIAHTYKVSRSDTPTKTQLRPVSRRTQPYRRLPGRLLWLNFERDFWPVKSMYIRWEPAFWVGWGSLVRSVLL